MDLVFIVVLFCCGFGNRQLISWYLVITCRQWNFVSFHWWHQISIFGENLSKELLQKWTEVWEFGKSFYQLLLVIFIPHLQQTLNDVIVNDVVPVQPGLPHSPMEELSCQDSCEDSGGSCRGIAIGSGSSPSGTVAPWPKIFFIVSLGNVQKLFSPTRA